MPERLGKYEIMEQIGRGAMGEVYRAHDPILGRNVAIKTMIPKVGTDPELRRRFQREAQSAARLNHPNIVTVFDLVEEQGQSYIAMELLEGIDLREAIARRTLPSLDEKLSVMEQVADALAFAHARDVIHRDVKPANIHILSGGQVKLMDFGLARLGASEMTATGMVLGTPHYMSPEQVRGEKADARSDIFSTGAVFYELLCNRKAFDAESLHAILFRVLEYQPESIRKWVPEIPDDVVAIVEKCLAKDPAQRYQDGAALGEALHLVRGMLDPANQSSAGTVSSRSWASSRIRPPASRHGERSAGRTDSSPRPAVRSMRAAPPPPLPGRDAATQMLGAVPRPARRRSRAPIGVIGLVAAVVVGAAGSWYWFLAASRSQAQALPVPQIESSTRNTPVAGDLPSKTSPSSPTHPASAASGPDESRAQASGAAPSGNHAPEPSAGRERPSRGSAPSSESLDRSRETPPERVADLRPSAQSPGSEPAVSSSSSYVPSRTAPVAQPPSTPLAAPMPVPTSMPTPVPTPAPVKEEPLVRQAIANYAQAIESKDIDLFRAVMPGLSSADERNLRAAFAGNQRQTVQITIDSIQIRGNAATVRLTRNDTIANHTVTSHQTMALAKNGSAWVITHIGR